MRAAVVAGLALAGLAAAPPSPAASPPASASPSGAAASARASRPRFAAGASMVLLSATAVDKRGRPVTDLAARDFKVFEDGREQPLVHFSKAAASSARLLVLFDGSGSMTGPRKSADARMAVTQLLAALDAQDEAALAIFDNDYRAAVPFTRDRKAVERALDVLQPFGSTALHDALSRAAEQVAAEGEGRRAVVVVTDGIDTASRLSPDVVIARSRALDVPIYAVTVVSPLDDPWSDRFAGDREAARKGNATLARYASLSGGVSFTVSEPGTLLAAARRIVGELKHQYRLGYDPPAGPTRFRRIEVRSTRKGVQVRTRSGYVPRT